MTEKQILEEMVAEAKKLPYEEQCMLLGAARGMGMMRMAQPVDLTAADAKSEDNSAE